MNRFTKPLKLISRKLLYPKVVSKEKLKFGIIYNEYLGLPLAAGGFLYSFKLVNPKEQYPSAFGDIIRVVFWPWVAAGCTVSGMALGTFPLPTLTVVGLWKLGGIFPLK